MQLIELTKLRLQDASGDTEPGSRTARPKRKPRGERGLSNER